MVLRVLHLVGSAVSDFHCELSRLYAQDCLRSTADTALYDVHIAYVTPDRQWRFPADLSRAALGAAQSMSCAEAVQRLVRLNVDVMVPQMFCVPGMTHYRALFDVLSIPYLGNTPDVMALTVNKAKAKAVVAGVGVSVPRGELVCLGAPCSIEPPAVVKPVDADNSVGVGLVRSHAQYDAALQEALTYADEALVESFIEPGREVRCGIVVEDGQLVCLPLEEYNVDGERKPIRNYDDKIRRDQHGDLKLVAKESSRAWVVEPSDPVTERVWDVARACHSALGCRHYSLFDFRIDPSGRPWFLEAGLYCSFAESSVISAMAKASGRSVAELFRIAVDNALGLPAAWSDLGALQ